MEKTRKDLTDIFIELHVPDFRKAMEFYKILGFRIARREKDYLVMKRGQSILNFYGGSGKVCNQNYFRNFPKETKRGYAVEIIIQVKNVQKFYEKIKNKVKVVQPLRKRKWKAYDFRVEDPFGFYLRITEAYPMLKYRLNNP
ncbi:MAG: VOC family protein [Candidatus Aenigmarchaeota archaeon]|nr:VOC family protein [Candidatus Aenigmarchaeota archaeon]